MTWCLFFPDSTLRKISYTLTFNFFPLTKGSVSLDFLYFWDLCWTVFKNSVLCYYYRYRKAITVSVLDPYLVGSVSVWRFRVHYNKMLRLTVEFSIFQFKVHSIEIFVTYDFVAKDKQFFGFQNAWKWGWDLDSDRYQNEKKLYRTSDVAKHNRRCRQFYFAYKVNRRIGYLIKRFYTPFSKLLEVTVPRSG